MTSGGEDGAEWGRETSPHTMKRCSRRRVWPRRRRQPTSAAVGSGHAVGEVPFHSRSLGPLGALGPLGPGHAYCNDTPVDKLLLGIARHELEERLGDA